MNIAANRSVWYIMGFWVLLALVCVVAIMPLRKKLRFGIDLVGGTSITLEVQTEKAVEVELVDTMQKLVSSLKTARKALPVSKVVENGEIVLTFNKMEDAQEAASFIRLSDSTLVQTAENAVLKLRFSPAVESRIKADAVQGNIEVLNSRLNSIGVEETPIAALGEKNIFIELPGIDNPQTARDLIGKSAKLEFKLVEDEGRSEEDILYKFDGVLPPDKQLVNDKHEGHIFLVSKYSDLTGKLLSSSWASLGGDLGNEVVVNLKFNPAGAEKFYEMTRKSTGKRLAILLDNVVLVAPQIIKPISGGQCYINGMRSMEEAKELAILLKSGAFIAPVTFEEERQMESSLGTEAIHSGLMACLLGMLLLLIFGVVLYRYSGLLAFFVLLYNLLLIVFGLYVLRATLTLPGIAGMVLTVGMAIDASVLIFERIREELATGLSVKKAVDTGFSDAMVVILDANITTLIVGVVLYFLGTGPVQGFAVTMVLGILSTLITGLFLLKSLFNFILDTFNVQKLSI